MVASALLWIVIYGSGADGRLIANLEQIVLEFFEGGKFLVGCECLHRIDLLEVLLQSTAYHLRIA